MRLTTTNRTYNDVSNYFLRFESRNHCNDICRWQKINATILCFFRKRYFTKPWIVLLFIIYFLCYTVDNIGIALKKLSFYWMFYEIRHLQADEPVLMTVKREVIGSISADDKCYVINTIISSISECKMCSICIYGDRRKKTYMRPVDVNKVTNHYVSGIDTVAVWKILALYTFLSTPSGIICATMWQSILAKVLTAMAFKWYLQTISRKIKSWVTLGLLEKKPMIPIFVQEVLLWNAVLLEIRISTNL